MPHTPRGDGAFHVEIRRDYRDESLAILWRSQLYDAHGELHLRHDWAYRCGDPSPLVRYIDELVGGTLRNFDRCQIDPQAGHEMAIALEPGFLRQIYHFMERMEGRPRFDEIYRRDAAILSHDTGWESLRVPWFPPEDPAATKKATALLISNLDAGQRKSFAEKKLFVVVAKDQKAYTIKHARSFNVIGPDGTKYCGQLADTPIEDQMLAQKILLENDPEKFFKNANSSPGSDMTGMRIMMHGDGDPLRRQRQDVMLQSWSPVRR